VVSFGGDSFRYENDNRNWLPGKGQWLAYTYTSTCNGDTCKQFFSMNSQGFPDGMIRPGNKYVDINDAPMFPVLATYRALNPGMNLAPSKEKPWVERGKCLVDGRECLAFDCGVANKYTTQTAYVDPAMDYSVVRVMYTANGNGKVFFNIDIRYKPTAEFGWVPWEWDAVDVSDMHPGTRTAVVKEYSLNVPLPAGEFDITFPPGTFVSDVRHSPEGRKMLVKPSGELRPILREELIHGSY